MTSKDKIEILQREVAVWEGMIAENKARIEKLKDQKGWWIYNLPFFPGADWTPGRFLGKTIVAKDYGELYDSENAACGSATGVGGCVVIWANGLPFKK